MIQKSKPLGIPLESAIKAVGITSLYSGTPAVAWKSSSCSALANEIGLPELCIEDPSELPALLDRLSDPAERQRIVTAAVKHLGVTMAARSIGRRYATMIDKYTYRKVPGQPRRPGCILFITHNLEAAEGAPRSLLELAQGLRERFHHDVVVLSFVNGKLGQEYRIRSLRLVTLHDSLLFEGFREVGPFDEGFGMV